MSDYMGGSDDAKRDWLVNFNNVTGASPGVYLFRGADVSAVDAAVDAFVTALGIARGELTRNKTTVAQKNDCRDAAVGLCRQYAKLIKYNAGIDAAAKIAAGIKPPSNTVEPVECPLSSPVVIPVAATNGAHTLGYKDSIDLTARSKPAGAVDLLLFRTISTAATTDPEAAKFIGKFTKNPMAITFESEDNGKIATYFARWSSRRGGMSNWSAPASMAIAA
jgi:hypothetical protein